MPQDLEQAVLLLGRSEEERARLEAELRDARGATAGAALVAQQLPVRAPLVWQFHPFFFC